MSSIIGNSLKISIFGQSHAKGIGIVIDGLPAGIHIDSESVQAFMDRRAPGNSAFSTARKEADIPIVLSGLVDDITCGAPLCAIFENADVRSEDYEAIRAVPRPSHSDFAAFAKYGTAHDIRGGGQFSGRLTAPLCFAGAVAMQILSRIGIAIGAHIAAIGAVEDSMYDPVLISEAILKSAAAKPFPVLDDAAGEQMLEIIEAARNEQDSVGGVVECCIIGMPAGVGNPMFEGIENKLAQLIFGIPAVKGIEFGAGFKSARLKGSQNNDPFYMDTQGQIKTSSNNHGGILGGISSGMPIIFRAAFKPTPSIGKPQSSVDLRNKTAAELVIKGRHDPCIVPRALPCVEAASAIAILDLMLGFLGEANI